MAQGRLAFISACDGLPLLICVGDGAYRCLGVTDVSQKILGLVVAICLTVGYDSCVGHKTASTKQKGKT